MKKLKAKRERLPVLVSYAYLRKMKDADIERLLTCKDFHIMLDSGAYTAFSSGKPIDVKDYIAFLKEWKAPLAHYVALDVIGEPEPTRKNFYAMLEAGLEPMPVFVTGEKKPWLDELYKHADVVAIPASKPVAVSLAVRKKFLSVRLKWAAGRKVHWFGFTNWNMITQLRPFSCDSTTWNNGAKYGNITAYIGRGKMTAQLGYKRYMRSAEVRRTVNRVYERFGYNPEELLDKETWRYQTKTRTPEENHMWQTTMRSWIEYSLEARKHLGTYVFLSAAPGSLKKGELFWFRHWLKQRRGG